MITFAVLLVSKFLKHVIRLSMIYHIIYTKPPSCCLVWCFLHFRYYCWDYCCWDYSCRSSAWWGV